MIPEGVSQHPQTGTGFFDFGRRAESVFLLVVIYKKVFYN